MNVRSSSSIRPLVLFGACDRHNLGDLLFVQLAARRWAARRPIVCGLADRDLRAVGGHRVRSLHRLAREGALAGADLLHVGGEILTCTAHEAAAMLLAPDVAEGSRSFDATLAQLEREPARAAAWREEMLGTPARMPYVASRELVPGLRRVLFAPVGGVALDGLDASDRDAVIARLASADVVQVRDATTRMQLEAAGLGTATSPAATTPATTLLAPDPVTLVADAFAAVVAARAARGPVAALRRELPSGWLAVQLASEFDDDATLEALASALADVARDRRLAVIAFRAGTAPWHDDPRTPPRLVERLRELGIDARDFASTSVRDLCALLAHARCFAGSSLHGLVVATAFGLPAVGLEKPGEPAGRGKVASYVATWHRDGTAAACPADALAATLQAALATDAGARRAAASARVAALERALETLDAVLA